MDKIKVINSRNREEDQLEMNTESIEQVGLVETDTGQRSISGTNRILRTNLRGGSIIAHKKMNAETVKAEVVTCSRKEAYLQSLIENIARTKPGSMDFARELKRLYDEGWTYEQISKSHAKTRATFGSTSSWSNREKIG